MHDDRSPSDPRLVATVRHQVSFSDLDPMQVVWHGNYARYFDLARQALFDRAGVDLYGMSLRDEGHVFPVVRFSTKHIHPLRLRDVFDCTARLVEARTKLVLDFEIRLASTGVVCTRGRSEQATLKVPELTLEFQVPAEIRWAFGLE